LELARTNLTDVDIRRVISNFQNLEELDLTGCSLLTVEGFRWLSASGGLGGAAAAGASGVRGCTHLKNVRFPHRDMEGMDLVLGRLCKSFGKYEKGGEEDEEDARGLEVVDLEGFRFVTDDGVLELENVKDTQVLFSRSYPL
jgi:hypothetical protein